MYCNPDNSAMNSNDQTSTNDVVHLKKDKITAVTNYNENSLLEIDVASSSSDDNPSRSPGSRKRALEYAEDDSDCSNSPNKRPRRSERDRARHNEVERKRKQNIKVELTQLGKLVPDKGSKHTQYSILRSAVEYINELRGQVSELSNENRELKAQQQVLMQSLAKSNSAPINNNPSSYDTPNSPLTPLSIPPMSSLNSFRPKNGSNSNPPSSNFSPSHNSLHNGGYVSGTLYGSSNGNINGNNSNSNRPSENNENNYDRYYYKPNGPPITQTVPPNHSPVQNKYSPGSINYLSSNPNNYALLPSQTIPSSFDHFSPTKRSNENTNQNSHINRFGYNLGQSVPIPSNSLPPVHYF